MDTSWTQRALGHAAWVCLCQIASQWLKRPSTQPDPKFDCLELFVCNCVLAVVVMSARAGR
jgi:hypothetical protein